MRLLSVYKLNGGFPGSVCRVQDKSGTLVLDDMIPWTRLVVGRDQYSFIRLYSRCILAGTEARRCSSISLVKRRHERKYSNTGESFPTESRTGLMLSLECHSLASSKTLPPAPVERLAPPCCQRSSSTSSSLPYGNSQVPKKRPVAQSQLSHRSTHWQCPVHAPIKVATSTPESHKKALIRRSR
jgi:hypothetical protein